MAFRNKKLVSEPEVKTEPETEPAEKEENEERTPYKVFDTREEYEAAMGGGKAEPDTASAERDNRIALWQRDAYMLKIAVPEFDFETALRNDEFRRVLAGGGTVFEAYAAITKPAPNTRREIRQNAQNDTRGTGDSGVNPSKLSTKDFKEYIDKIRNS